MSAADSPQISIQLIFTEADTTRIIDEVFPAVPQMGSRIQFEGSLWLIADIDWGQRYDGAWGPRIWCLYSQPVRRIEDAAQAPSA